MRNAITKRPAYTLMEVTLALAIAVLLLASMYVAFNVVVRQVIAGRQSINDADVPRALARGRHHHEDAGCGLLRHHLPDDQHP